MKNTIYFIITLLILSCKLKKENIKITNNDKLINSIDSIINANFSSTEPGAAIIITKKGKEIYKNAVGLANLNLNVAMNSEMIFRIGSITKQFTAVSILMLQEEGRLSITDNIRKHLPTYPKHEQIITIENLLTHTSGIPDFLGFPEAFKIEQMNLTTNQIVGIFKDKPLEFNPGEQIKYSNSGYNVLGAIVEKVSGMSYENFVETKIFQKLNMKSSFYDHPEEIFKNKISGYTKDSLGYKSASYMTMCAPFSAGGLRSSISDLAIWNKAIHNGELIPLKSLSKAFKPFKLKNGTYTDYGFGWMIHDFLGEKLYHHSGSIPGFRNSAFYFPKEEIYIAILSNNFSSKPSYLNNVISSVVFNKNIKKPVEIWDKQELKKLFPNLYKKSTLN